MADETLLSASRRAVRFFMIDMNKGGLITPDTEAAMQTLDRQWRLEAGGQESNDHNDNAQPV